MEGFSITLTFNGRIYCLTPSTLFTDGCGAVKSV
nr:MAG TPA: hypothetical protein [Caudoviricetes sp.]